MPFAAVYYTLQDVFPQVDLRILKAVASQYSSDVDAAVEFVLSDVLPAVADIRSHTGQNLDTGSYLRSLTLEENLCNFQPAGDVSESSGVHNADLDYKNDLLYAEPNEEKMLTTDMNNYACSSAEQDYKLLDVSESFRGNNGSNLSNSKLSFDLMSDDKYIEPELFASPVSVLENSGCADGAGKNPFMLNDDFRTTELSFLSILRNSLPEGGNQSGKHRNAGDIYNSDDNYSISAIHRMSEPLSTLFGMSEPLSATEGHLCSSQMHDFSLAKHGQQMLQNTPSMEVVSSLSEVEVNCNLLQLSSSSKISVTATPNAQLDHVAQINAVNNVISDMSESKDSLAHAYELAFNKLTELEEQEENVKLLKEESVSQDKDFAAMASDFEETVKNLKQSNEKLVEELNDDKALLSTTAQNIQAQLISVSEQRNEGLLVIEQMNCMLSTKLASVMNEKEKLEDEIASKEELTHQLLKEHGTLLDQLKKESQRLQEEVQEGITLRELMLERSHMVGKLQGEISGIYKNIMALKEQVDRHVEAPNAADEMASAGNAEILVDSVCGSQGSDSSVLETLNAGINEELRQHSSVLESVNEGINEELLQDSSVPENVNEGSSEELLRDPTVLESVNAGFKEKLLQDSTVMDSENEGINKELIQDSTVLESENEGINEELPQEQHEEIMNQDGSEELHQEDPLPCPSDTVDAKPYSFSDDEWEYLIDIAQV